MQKTRKKNERKEYRDRRAYILLILSISKNQDTFQSKFQIPIITPTAADKNDDCAIPSCAHMR